MCLCVIIFSAGEQHAFPSLKTSPAMPTLLRQCEYSAGGASYYSVALFVKGPFSNLFPEVLVIQASRKDITDKCLLQAWRQCWSITMPYSFADSDMEVLARSVEKNTTLKTLKISGDSRLSYLLANRDIYYAVCKCTVTQQHAAGA
jgi:hypothetical protein